jgi:hypothetical protein
MPVHPRSRRSNRGAFLFLPVLTLACVGLASFAPGAQAQDAQPPTEEAAPASPDEAAPAEAAPAEAAPAEAVPAEAAPAEAAPAEATPTSRQRRTRRPRATPTATPNPDASAATPAPEVSPSGNPAPAPTATPVGTDAKKERTPEEREKAWQEKTPPHLSRRLFLGAATGLGTGGGPEADYTSDRLGAQVFLQYVLTPPSLDAAQNPSLRWVTEIQYATHTGVDTKSDESLSVQAFLVGGGADFKLGARGPVDKPQALPFGSVDRMRLQALGFAGLTKRMAFNLDTGTRPDSKYGASVGVEGRYLHAVWDRIEAYGGLGARVIGYSWFDFKLGVVASF